MGLLDAFVEAETIYNFLIARIAQHDAAATNQHRQIRDRNMEPIQKVLHFRIMFEINGRIWLIIPSKKFFDAEGVERMTRTN